MVYATTKCQCETPEEFLKYWEKLNVSPPDTLVLDYINRLYNEYKTLYSARKSKENEIKELKKNIKEIEDGILSIKALPFKQQKKELEACRGVDPLYEKYIFNGECG